MRKVLRYIAIILVLELIACLGTFVPVQAAGTIAFSSSSDDTGPVGTSVIVQGTGFSAAENVHITYDTTTVVSSFPVTTTFTKTFSIPNSAQGDHTIQAHGDNSGDSSSITFTVTPKITVNPTSGQTGSSVTVSGAGFAASDTNIVMTFDGIQVGQTKDSISATGSWTSTFTVPSTASAGTHTIGAYGDNTADGDVPGISFTVTANAGFTLSPMSGKVGSSVMVNGVGFAANETGISITYDGTAQGATTSAGSTGAWSITFSVPQSASGVAHVIHAQGATTTSVTDKTFTVIPSISLSKSSASPGTVITVNGTGFAAGETGINVTYDTQPVGAATSAGANGSWITTFTVPPGSSGSHNVNATGSSTTSVSTITFTVGAGISINPSSGAVGTSVTLSGSGFAAKEKSIAVTFDDTQVSTGITADTNGVWSAIFTVPASVSGDHTIAAQGATTKSISTTFTTVANASLSQTSGAAGSSITVNGSGFAANEKNIKVSFDDQDVATGITADAKGTWSTAFMIPASSSGSHTIKVAGSTTQSLSTGDISFKVKASISINPSSGSVGTSVTVKGSGFAPNSLLKFLYDDDDSKFNAGQVTTEADGSFSKVITVPKSAAGSHSIGVSDESGNKATQGFTIGSTPPSVPKPSSPADGARISLTGNITPTLRWSAATAGSSVTYNLQIDTDPEFSNPIVDKTGLAKPSYTLSKAEALSLGTYYWRIKAVDAAGNESDWSKPLMLQSGLMSTGILVLIIILAIVAIGLLVFFLLLPMLRKRKAMAPAAEIVIPEIVNAEYRTLDPEETKKKALPWRLALPQAPPPAKGARTLSPEDQARLKVIIDFAKSLPLVEPGSSTNWLIDLAENGTGNTASPALYAQLLKNEIQVRYEPAWMRHPTFLDLQTLLEGQPIIQDLNSFVDSVNRTTSESVLLLQDIYKDATAEITWDILANGGWAFISGVYTDSLSWFLGKNLREPSDRDYTIKSEGNTSEGTGTFGLYGEQNTSFSGLLIQAPEEKDALQLRVLHLKLRRTYRNSDRARDVVSMITQLEVQRGRLLSAFSQFSRLNP